MVTPDPREISVGGRLDIDKVFIEQVKAHIGRESTSAGVEDSRTDSTTAGRDIREHTDVIILCPTELALIKVLKNLGPVVLEIAKAHVQNRGRRDGAVIVHTRRVIHLVL